MARPKRKYSFMNQWVIAAVVAIGLVLILVVSNLSSRNQINRTGAAPILNVGVMGDSVTDEYRADDNRGGAYAATTLNWLELLQKYGNVNFGTWGSWGGHRRMGYEFNYSRSGATTTTGLAANAHVALGQLVNAERVQIVYYQLGSNDFAYYNAAFDDIYSGRLSGASLDAYISNVVNNVKIALNEINKSNKAKMIVSLVPDMTVVPAARARFPDATKLKRVSDAVKKTNDGIRAEINLRGYATFDTERLIQQILTKVDAQGNLSIGGEKISFATSGDEPHHVQLSDSIHAGTVYGGIYANEWADTLNRIFSTQLTLFTEQDLLVYSGIKKATTSPTMTATVRPTASATATPVVTLTPTIAPTATAAPTQTPIVTIKPTATPIVTAKPTPVVTIRPTVRPTATPSPTANPYAQYCNTYRSLRSFLVRFLSAASIREWDLRCKI